MITQDKILSIPIFKMGFEMENHKAQLETFVNDINLGKGLDVKSIIHDLIEMAVANCRTSLGYRTVAYDFAWAVLEANPSLWNKEEIENNYSMLDDHWKEFYPEDDGTFDDYDVCSLDEAEYFIHAMKMISENEIMPEKKPMFSYATYLFFNDSGREELSYEELLTQFEEFGEEEEEVD